MTKKGACNMKELKVAMVGFGEIGQAFAKLLLDKQEDIRKRFDTRISVVCIGTKSRGCLVDAWGIDLHKALDKINKTGSLEGVLGYENVRTPMELIETMEYAAKNQIAEFADIFCEKNVFNIEQSRRFLSKAKELGLKLKIHADEMVQLGGTELAVELACTSADHLLKASDEAVKMLSSSNTVATLLPATAFCLKEEYARGRYMIDSGCAVALATDFNPGSCFTNSIPLIIALAALYMNMSVEEIITALTINGAAAVGRSETIGSIEKGKKADIIILEYPSIHFLPYHAGVNIVKTVIKNGEIIKENQ